MFLYDFATKTAQKPDTVATYIRRNEKIFKNHVERREKQLWLDEKAVKILLKKYPEVQRKKILLRFQKTLARAKITNDMSEIAARLENIYVCGCFPLQFFVRSKHPICPTNDK